MLLKLENASKPLNNEVVEIYESFDRSNWNQKSKEFTGLLPADNWTGISIKLTLLKLEYVAWLISKTIVSDKLEKEVKLINWVQKNNKTIFFILIIKKHY